VQDGRLVEVGGRLGPARREIQADGLAVAPGFIDSHTHLDAQLLWDPFATSCFHGVTSVVTGNCGLSLMPCTPENRETLLGTFSRVEGMEVDVLRSAVPWSWSDTAGYLDAVAKSRPSLNVGVLVGHCALRQHVMGEASVERAASDDEIRAMQQELGAAMGAGALGFSTNQNARHFRADGKPVPTRLAEPAEIQALGDVLGRLGRGVIQMSLAPGGIARIDAIADLSLRIRRPVVWNTILHFWSNPDLWRQQLEKTAQAFARGARPWASPRRRAPARRDRTVRRPARPPGPGARAARASRARARGGGISSAFGGQSRLPHLARPARRSTGKRARSHHDRLAGRPTHRAPCRPRSAAAPPRRARPRHAPPRPGRT